MFPEIGQAGQFWNCDVSYSHGTFGKDSSQWTKCVVKYLHDVYTVT